MGQISWFQPEILIYEESIFVGYIDLGLSDDRCMLQMAILGDDYGGHACDP